MISDDYIFILYMWLQFQLFQLLKQLAFDVPPGAMESTRPWPDRDTNSNSTE